MCAAEEANKVGPKRKKEPDEMLFEQFKEAVSSEAAKGCWANKELLQGVFISMLQKNDELRGQEAAKQDTQMDGNVAAGLSSDSNGGSSSRAQSEPRTRGARSRTRSRARKQAEEKKGEEKVGSDL